MTRLTKNFTLAEFTVSEKAKLANIPNTPSPAHMPAIVRTAYAAQCIRDMTYFPAVPLIITSAYRNSVVNKLVGGVANSDHTEGNAFDFHFKGIDTKVSCLAVEAMLKRTRLPFHKMILELDRGIIHMSFDPELAGLFMTQVGGPGGDIYAGIRPELG